MFESVVMPLSKGLKYIPTKKIEQILDDPYLRGNSGEGREYHEDKEELQAILWERQNREQEQNFKEQEQLWEAYQDEH